MKSRLVFASLLLFGCTTPIEQCTLALEQCASANVVATHKLEQCDMTLDNCQKQNATIERESRADEKRMCCEEPRRYCRCP